MWRAGKTRICKGCGEEALLIPHIIFNCKKLQGERELFGIRRKQEDTEAEQISRMLERPEGQEMA